MTMMSGQPTRPTDADYKMLIQVAGLDRQQIKIKLRHDRFFKLELALTAQAIKYLDMGFYFRYGQVFFSSPVHQGWLWVRSTRSVPYVRMCEALSPKSPVPFVRHSGNFTFSFKSAGNSGLF